MNQKKVQYFKNLLISQLAELEEKSNKNRVSSLAEPEHVLDFTDRATLESDFDMNIHIKERDSRLKVKIKEALEKIGRPNHSPVGDREAQVRDARLEVVQEALHG